MKWQEYTKSIDRWLDECREALRQRSEIDHVKLVGSLVGVSEEQVCFCFLASQLVDVIMFLNNLDYSEKTKQQIIKAVSNLLLLGLLIEEKTGVKK